MPITRTFKGNRKRFELLWVRVIEGKISKKMTWRGIKKGSSYRGFELSGFNCIRIKMSSYDRIEIMNATVTVKILLLFFRDDNHLNFFQCVVLNQNNNLLSSLGKYQT